MRVRLTIGNKWVVALGAVLLMLAAIPLTTEAHGKRWSGIDPRIDINGEQLNVRVEWDRKHTCDIVGPIDVVVKVPARSDVTFLGESAERFDCDGDGRYDTAIATKTRIEERSRGNRVVVSAKVDAPGSRFPTRIELFKNMELTDICPGPSNKWYRCKGPKF